MRVSALPILVYDSGCGPCADFRNVVGFLDPKRKITFLSLAEADRMHLLDPIPRRMRYSSFHLFTSGKIESGASALPELFGQFPGGNVTRRALRGFSVAERLVSSAYGVLSRLHNSGSCNASLGNPQGCEMPSLEYAQKGIKSIKQIPSP